ncbi:hypothetical protein EON67_08500 [archaeon]|nr:MAG: hypothetical protein EON67_08500 [archaeon]
MRTHAHTHVQHRGEHTPAATVAARLPERASAAALAEPTHRARAGVQSVRNATSSRRALVTTSRDSTGASSADMVESGAFVKGTLAAAAVTARGKTERQCVRGYKAGVQDRGYTALLLQLRQLSARC